MRRNLTLAVLALLLTLGLTSAAHADAIDFSLYTPSQSANPGDTIYMFAQLSENNGDAVFFNADTFSIEAPITLDDSPLFYNFDQLFFPYQIENGLLFTLTLPLDIPTGTYLGSFSIYGGPGFYDLDFISEQDFSVSVVNNNSFPGVPEPSSLLLLGTGLVGAFGVGRRKVASV